MGRKVLATTLLIATIFVGFLALPVFFDSGVLDNICTLPKAQAQDNPCLEQEATVSALRVQVLESQGTSVALQSTVVALEAIVDTNTLNEEQSTQVGLPFSEDFSTNLRGWQLAPNNAGVASISNEQLRVTVNAGRVYWHPIPDVRVGDCFRIEATLNTNHNFASQNFSMGFGIGDTNTGRFHLFTGGTWQGWNVIFYDQLTPLIVNRFGVNRNTLWQSNTPVTFILEANQGLFTLSIGSVARDTAQITPYGDEIGLAVYSGDDRSYSVIFDNIDLREC